jgi:hypothetical protein
MKLGMLLPVLLILLLPVSAVSAPARENRRDPGDGGDRLEKQERKVEKQDQRIDDLEKQLEELRKKIEKAEKEDEKQKLIEEADRLSVKKKEPEAPEDRKFYGGLRQHSAMNPNISVIGDFYYAHSSSDSDYNTQPSETSYGTGRLYLKEVELALEAVLDPYSRAKAFIGIGEDGAGVEEGYIELFNMPLNINLKLGRFKVQFGEMNRYHCHALPQFDRARVLVNYFSRETLHGDGVGMNILLPSIFAHVNELDLQLVSGGSGLSFTDEGRNDFLGVIHLKNYWDLSRATYLEFGLSGAFGHNDPEQVYLTSIGGADLRIRWTPPGRVKYREFLWWTEALVSRRDVPGGYIDSWGMFSLVRYRFGARWVGSARFDYSQLPNDASAEEYGGSLNLDFWQSEFVFFRLQYSIFDRNFEESDQRILCQAVWALGPHKHEAY